MNYEKIEAVFLPSKLNEVRYTRSKHGVHRFFASVMSRK